MTGGKGGGGGEGSRGAVGGSHTLDRTTTDPNLWDARPHEGGGEEVREREKEEGWRLDGRGGGWRRWLGFKNLF
jgi:hypothetical protein